MREKFIEFYEPNEKELDNSWNNGLVCLDANVLLNLYRYTENTRNDFLEVLKILTTRLWIPYQAGFEFQNNRLGVIKSHKKAYKELIDNLIEKEKALTKEINKFKNHPYFMDLENILKELQDDIIKIRKKVIKIEQKHPDYIPNDPILKKIEKLLKGRIGDSFTDKELSEIYKEGKIRYDKKTPPGYEDQAKKAAKGDQSLYGDLIIWKELIKKAKEGNEPIIFVTDDRKEDWWENTNPRKELIREFYNETKIRILIYNADIFLKYAKKRLKTTIKESSISEIRNIREEDKLKHLEFDVSSGLANIEDSSSLEGILKKQAYLDNSLIDAAFGTTNPAIEAALGRDRTIASLKSISDFNSINKNIASLNTISALEALKDRNATFHSLSGISLLDSIKSINNISSIYKTIADINKFKSALNINSEVKSASIPSVTEKPKRKRKRIKSIVEPTTSLIEKPKEIPIKRRRKRKDS